MTMDVVAFCCEHSAYRAADLAGNRRLCCPQGLRIIPVPCAGRVDVIHILKAFEKGAAGVLLLGCEDGACHHLTGNARSKYRVEYARMLLKEVGIDERRLKTFGLAPNAPHKLTRLVNEFDKELGELETIR